MTLSSQTFVKRAYRLLNAAYGDLRWWPARTRFAVMVGAILTQGTAWRNVERALDRLHRARVMTPARLVRLPRARLEALIRPAGFFRVKARRLQAFLRMLQDRYDGRVAQMFRTPTGRLRRDLLAIHGIGPETADAILLYAGQRPLFVVDAYTRRILLRHGVIEPKASYDDIAALFARVLPRRARWFNAYHAWLVEVGKSHCRTTPICTDCPLGRLPLADGTIPDSYARHAMKREVIRG